MRHRDKVVIQRKLQQGKRRKENTSVETFHLKYIIFKMRVPILVLTLVVIYGACGIYAEESTGLIKEELGKLCVTIAIKNI
jgi:hypothetical protein